MNQSSLQGDREKYNSGYYDEKLEQGLQFQDVVTSELYQRGIVVIGYASRKYQNECGENMLGAEIKRDGLFRETGNLYIETAEKSHPDKSNYVLSGIYRDDNSWLFVIGDEETIYIFSTKYLRLLERRYEQKTKTTSKGFIMPIVDAEKYCIRKIDLQEGS
jgi:hypothetical protein